MRPPQQPRAEQQDDADRYGQDDADGAVGAHTGAIAWLVGWGPVLGWLVVIAWLSGEGFSDEQTAAWLVGAPLLDALWIPPALVDTANLILRKSAHFVEYAILSMLTFRALGVGAGARPIRRRIAGALLLAVVCAALDEIHQATTVTRSGSPRDVLINGLGAAGGVLVARVFAARRRRAGA